MKITRQQLQALADQSRHDFISRSAEFLRSTWPSQTNSFSDHRLRDLIHASIVRAEEYGIEIEADVIRFVETSLLLGEDFDTSAQFPWAAEFLQDEFDAPWMKMVRIVERRNRLLGIEEPES